ncbi:hypothetical protein SB18R_10730 [Pseudomonas oryzihabitans]|nr:methyl-accepting chemotaxis protein [Pseudomonas rhizoryzae]KTT33078.1 hypothetical protein NS201_06080 [Pseudomonas psychrotolerans]KTT37825.1 hypothetical protein SB9_01115 [Pseudomonas psychrotolerans]KTT76488.1 hypothetical protein SB18R_10730 [Pseudomonas psychrotolerans]
MKTISNTRLATRLLAAFVACACITLLVGVVTKSGIGNLSGLLETVFSRNLVAVSEANAAVSTTIAQNRDLYRFLTLSAAYAPLEERQSAKLSLDTDRTSAERAFAAYSRIPQVDEALGQQIGKEWPSYQAAVKQAVDFIEQGDFESARVLLAGDLQRRYQVVLGILQAAVDANNRMIGEGAQVAQKTVTRANASLYLGILVAFVAAIALGLLITRSITRPIARAVASARRVAEGDLTAPIASDRLDEPGQLLRALASMQENLRRTLGQLDSASAQLASAATQFSVTSAANSRDLVAQDGEIQQAATAVNQLAKSVDEVARNAVSVLASSQETQQETQTGRDQVEQAVTIIDSLGRDLAVCSESLDNLVNQAVSIGTVADVIRGLAEQTNLLALNAAIEAARAGEQGRGFAVVADEVRALASRTQSSIGEIERIVSGVQQAAGQAVVSMKHSQTQADEAQQSVQEAHRGLGRISAAMEGIDRRNQAIASATEQQAQVSREVDRNLGNIQQLSAKSAQGATQTNVASQELAQLASSFRQLVAGFHL